MMLEKIKNILTFVKDYIGFAYTLFLSLLILSDYSIFTSVFNMNHASFFNFFLFNTFSSQSFIIFVLLPIVFVTILLISVKIQYSVFKKLKIINYFLTSKQWIVYVSLVVMTIIILLEDVVVFYLLDLINYFSHLNTFFFFVFMTILYGFLNLLTVIYIFSLLSIFKNSPYTRATIIIGLIILKTLVMFFIGTHVATLAFLFPISIINSAFFLFVFSSLFDDEDTDEEDKKQTNFKRTIFKMGSLFILIPFILFTLNFLFNGLVEKSYESYKQLKFWDTLQNNTLSKTNFTLLFNPLKIMHHYDSISFAPQNFAPFANNLSEAHHIKAYNFFDKQKDKITLNPSKEKEVFSLPVGDNSLLFIHSLDNNKTILVLSITDKKKIFDMGYIELEKGQEKGQKQNPTCSKQSSKSKD